MKVHVTASREVLYLQYPGKETKAAEERARPFDFRPKLHTESGVGRDLSFQAIWENLEETCKRLRDSDGTALRALALMMYRLAYTADHQHFSPINTQIEILELDDEDRRVSIVREDPLPGRWVYSPSKEVVEALGMALGPLGGMSLEAFLHYNDLLSWNEDVKYYYYDTKRETVPWKETARAPNNLLTHIRLIGAAIGEVSLADLMGGFSNSRGVSKASKDELAAIFGSLEVGYP